MSKVDSKSFPTPEYRFFIYDPEGNGHTYYKTAKERDEAAHDIIQMYLDDCWSEEVTQVVAGEITHHTVAKGVEFAPLIEDFDSDEEYMDAVSEFGGDPDWDYKCRYELAPLDDPGESTKRQK